MSASALYQYCGPYFVLLSVLTCLTMHCTVNYPFTPVPFFGSIFIRAIVGAIFSLLSLVPSSFPSCFYRFTAILIGPVIMFGISRGPTSLNPRILYCKSFSGASWKYPTLPMWLWTAQRISRVISLQALLLCVLNYLSTLAVYQQRRTVRRVFASSFPQFCRGFACSGPN